MQVIPTNVYGKHDNFSLSSGHVIPSLIHKCYLAGKSNTDFVVLGSGRPVRQFIYSKDLAKLMVWAVKNYSEPDPIILSASHELSIGEVAQAVAIALGFTGKLVFDTSQADGQFKKTVSNQKLERYLPNFEFTDIACGLAVTVRWFVENFQEARK